MRWFTYAMDADEPEAFSTLRLAVAHAQAAVGTERRPKRLEHGLYFIAGERGITRYIGTAKMFGDCGFAHAASRMAKL